MLIFLKSNVGGIKVSSYFLYVQKNPLWISGPQPPNDLDQSKEYQTQSQNLLYPNVGLQFKFIAL